MVSYPLPMASRHGAWETHATLRTAGFLNAGLRETEVRVMMRSNGQHHPVMLEKAMELLEVKRGGMYVDATLGGGGHTLRMLELGGMVLAIDCDQEAVAKAKRGFASHPGRELRIRHGNFKDLETICRSEAIGPVDGILADLGISSIQLDDPQRGFGFSAEGPLDMRMDSSLEFTAADMLASESQGRIQQWLTSYGQERYAGRIARAIVRARQVETISTTGHLKEIVLGAVPPEARRAGRIHPATRTFMAVRIAVNREPEALEAFMDCAAGLLAPGGRLVVISFHSGEDRIVKRRLQKYSGKCTCPREQPSCMCGAAHVLTVLTRTPLRPAPEETRANPRARSARLRAAERTVFNAREDDRASRRTGNV